MADERAPDERAAKMHDGQFRLIIAGEPGGDQWIASPA
jgi:hypothetical protein